MTGPATDSAELHDRRAAEDVIVRYAASIDDRDFDTYRTCFVPDVALHGFGAEVVHGIDAWMDFVHKALEPYEATQHMLGPPHAELRGDEALLRADVQAQHFQRSPKGRIFTLWGTYRSQLVRTDDAWRIKRHELVTRATRSSDAYRA